MSRIGASISGAQQYLLQNLAAASQASADASFRMTTGARINRPSDDISGFLRLSSLESHRSLVQTTLTQVSSAATMGAELQLTLDQVRTQLDTIRAALVDDEGGALDAAGRATAQTTIDTALEEINSLARTEINGRQVLDDSTDYSFSGLDRSQIRDLQVHATNGTTISGTVTGAATQAQVVYTGPGGRTSAAASFTLQGGRGDYSFSVAFHEDLDDVADRLNEYSHRTGVTAVAVGNSLTLTNVDYGSAATLSLDVTSGTFATADTAGVDATATINGQSYTGVGNRFDVSDNGLRFTAEIAEGFSGALSTVEISQPGVLKYALSTDISRLTRLALPGVSTALFRGLSGSLDDLATGGSAADLGDNTSTALRIVDEALSRLTRIEARVDSFADIAVANASELHDGLETILDNAIETLNGVDDEVEEQNVARYDSLASNAISALALLQQQQTQFTAILRQMAGLD